MSTQQLLLKQRDYGVILGTLMFIDYLLTYWGINLLNFTTELNPLMSGVMRLPLRQGISLRILFIIIPIFLLQLAFSWSENKSRICKITKNLVYLQLLPITFHFVWMIQYFMFMNS